MKKITLLIFLLFIFSSSLFAQNWDWAKEAVVNQKTDVSEATQIDHGVAVDKAGDSYSVGRFEGDVSFGSSLLTTSYSDMFLFKSDAYGNIQWGVQSLSQTWTLCIPTSVATDNLGNVFVLGNFEDSISFNGITYLATVGGAMFLVKYDANGNLLWFKDADWVYGASMAADGFGNVYVTGFTFNSTVLGSFTLTQGFFIAKYDANGNVVWAKQNTGSSGAGGLSIAADQAGNACVLGSFVDTISFGSFTLITRSLPKTPPNEPNTAFLTKYDSQGNVMWAKQSVNTTSDADTYPTSVTMDGLDNVYTTGNISYGVRFDSYTLVAPTQEVYLVKYDSNGKVQWAEEGGAPSWYIYSISSGPHSNNGTYLELGSFMPVSQINFGSDTLNLDTANQAPSLLLQFNENGKLVCSNLFSEGGEDDGTTIVADGYGNHVYISGDIASPCKIGADSLPYGNDVAFVASWQTCEAGIDTAAADTNKPVLNDFACVYVPTAFSPNGDGHNDIEYVYGSSCINTMDFIIFDRWGNKVFESTNPAYGWDGAYKGQAMNTGTFMYYLTGLLQDGTAINKKGNITLVR